MSPLERYKSDLKSPEFNYDPAQEIAVKKLDDLYQRLLESQPEAGLGTKLSRLFQGLKSIEPVKGLYFWGGVGRGKTHLMDLFYEALPFEKKMRIHFHRFMREVHQSLTRLQGKKDPLDLVAKEISDKAFIICFDEFFVSDITDAMLLGGLMEALFSRGVSLVATSNIDPDNLYKDGLQRQRFLPAIALIKQHTEVLNIDGGIDYRLRALEQAPLYYSPIQDDTETSLYSCFQHLAPLGTSGFFCVESNVNVEIEGRNLLAKHVADDVIWFDFKTLCDGPRSQIDYIEIAKEFHAVLVSDVPQMGRHNDDMARRFILMVDEFYDRNIKLVISADVELALLYREGRLNFEFERTVSRLQEMQSHEYLARAHRA